MRRRSFLTTAAATAISGCRGVLPGFSNPCLPARIPDALAEHELMNAVLQGLRADWMWDAHVHLLGTGDGESGTWVNPASRSIFHPIRHTQFRFYVNAACVDSERIDGSYLERLTALHDVLPAGAKGMLLAFDYAHDENGRRRADLSSFHVPDSYAAAIAAAHPDRFEWVASIHPCREDAAEALRAAVAGGARAVKWLPPAMNIDPAAPYCDRFYAALVRERLPLLVHGGDEHAVHAARQEFGNPLRLRRPLEHGVRVIVAHCGSLGFGQDLDAGAGGRRRPNVELFARLMDEPLWEGRLFGEISALTQRNRLGGPLELVVGRADWHDRLINGSDYPLPAVLPLFSLRKMTARGYLSEQEAAFASDLRRHNALLFDLAVKRLLRVDGRGFGASVFESRRVFEAAGP